MSLENLGSRIKAERQSRGITQEQLAERVDISTNFMSLIENGRNMSVETLVRVSDVLGVTADYLLNDTLQIKNDSISEQILQNLSTLYNDERIYFLNMIKQYKNINR